MYAYIYIYIYIYIGIKLKWSRFRPGVAQRIGRGLSLLFHDRGTRIGWVVSITPRPHFTLGKHPVHILRSGRAENLDPNGNRYRIVQPLVSRFADWAVRPTHTHTNTHTHTYIYILLITKEFCHSAILEVGKSERQTSMLTDTEFPMTVACIYIYCSYLFSFAIFVSYVTFVLILCEPKNVRVDIITQD